MYASRAQKEATEALVKRLEAEGADPIVLDLGKSWDELDEATRQFLIEDAATRGRGKESK